ncbi:hypothetical protein [Gemmobacter denitrificans]|uniref:Uncharacterized protein n=1 Tax=Gemmobacter denitrificans TaxID=3123040 RepID=A0ABU8BPG3_9RHOB
MYFNILKGAVAALALTVTPALAEMWRCDLAVTRGFIQSPLLLSIDRKTGEGAVYDPIIAHYYEETPVRLSHLKLGKAEVTARWRLEIIDRSSARSKVDYKARLDTATGKISVSANVIAYPETKGARGTCEKIKD